MAAILLFQDLMAQQTGVWIKTINWGTGTRKEVFNVPVNYNASKKYKLIVALHGLGGDPQYYITFFGPMTKAAYDLSNNVCNSYIYPSMSPVYDNFIIVCPQAVGTNTDFWTPVGDTALITKAINDAISMYNIDTDYIYLNGLSLGGRSALRYGLINYKRFRGIQLWSPAIQSMNEANNLASFNFMYQNAKHIPITITAATQDGQLYNQTQTYRQISEAGGIVQLQTMFDYCHAPSPDPYTFNAIDFIDKNACSKKNNDAGIYEITSPSGSNCSTSITPRVAIQNKGWGNLTSATINYQIDNGPVQTINWTGNLAQLERAYLNLPTVSVTAGAHSLKVFTSAPNGSTDQVSANDAVTINFLTVAAGVSAVLNEGFEGQSLAQTGIFQTNWRHPAGWDQSGTNDQFYWELDTVAGGAYGQSKTCIHFNNASFYPGLSAPYNSGKKYSIMTPVYDFSNANSASLSYDYAYAPITIGNSLLTDSLAVKYSLDCGITWTTLLKKGGLALNTSGTTTWGKKENGTFFGPTASQWKTENIVLGTLAGQASVMLAFENISASGNLLYLDNFKLTGATSVAELNSESVIVYPNPTADVIYWQGLDGVMEVQLYDATGRRLNIKSSDEGSLSMQALSAGIYWLRLVTEDGMVVKKVVRE